ncbi:helix-turn-helix transcriptional regulator [Actinomadura sp. NEAU-AAG7]|uniref:helix-turn-helix domain-containing protein n=1 Tax=Actinomadura sp. NEAU-AAG7 TaxID=2839640 RepID=UPI001BE3F1D4|nr:helix-turn-helix transcriptional regulator [Actinomadura sp. NEAU-AAG7]MBT2207020.1 helix-turn-helix transcriptional regulator [Actinomadura sp. NEAU-AAG7]
MAEKKIPPGTAGQQVISALTRIREAQKLSYAELAKKLEAIGRPIPPLGLRRIERGDRRVDAEDLLALARALDVPPILLLFPVGIADSVQTPLGEGEVSTWDAARWFMGEGPFPSSLSGDEWAQRYGRGELDPSTGLHEWYEDPETGWRAGATPIRLMRRHEQQVKEYFAIPRLLRGSAEDSEVRSFLEAHFKDMVDAMQSAVERQILATRNEIRRLGFAPPRLPGDMAHLDPKG